jgi:drug/metabolite transporter (DMT)-like permease
MTEAQRQHRWRVILAFGLVYLFWGSTYLGIAIAVESIPPALMCGTRFLIAGTLIFPALQGRRIPYSRAAREMAVVGILLGQQSPPFIRQRHVPSGLSALLIAATPLWFLVLDSLLLGDHRISQRGLAGLVLGIVGVCVLLWPKLHAVNTIGRTELWWSLSLLFGSFSWALGSVLSKRWQSGADPFSSTAWQVVFAGVANMLFAIISGEFSRAVWTARGVGAVFYLIVCGSWIGYTAYIWLLEHVPTSKVATYAYVNPVVAVFLGWLVLHERVDHYILAGSAIVVASVILVTSAKIKKTKTVAEELPAVEAAGD